PPTTLIAAPLIGAALTAVAIGWDSDRVTRARAIGPRLTRRAWIAVALAVALTLLWQLPGVITDAGLSSNGLIPSGHTPIQFDEFVAVSNGRTPLVDYAPWYNALLPLE